MNIVSLKIKNFLSIADVEIKPGGNVVQVVGRNNQGKTSILKAIEFAVKGSSDGSLVKFGEDRAEVIVELADQTVINRKITSAGKQTVNVKKEGFQAGSPQAYLDALFEHSAFNPLDLLDPKRRNDAILQSIDIKMDEARLQSELNDGPLVKTPIPPLDYSQHGLKVIDTAHNYFYARRAEANKDAADKKKRWETYEADLPKDEAAGLSRGEVQHQMDDAVRDRANAIQARDAVIAKHADAKKAMDRLDKYSHAVDGIENEIKKAEAHMETLRARRAEGQKFVDQAHAEVPDNLEDQGPYVAKVNDLNVEVERIKGLFKDIERHESIGKQRVMIDQMKADYEAARQIADGLDERVNLLGGPLKAKLMSAAEMPIAGLTYKDGGFHVDGVPVDNLSSSKALKLAIGVARKLAKKTKLICIDGAELLDELTYAALLGEIKDDGFTYFVTRVGSAMPGTGAVIEMRDGEVVV